MSVEKLPDGMGYKVRWRDSAGKSRRKTVRLWRDAVSLDAEMKRKKVMGELITHEKGKITLNDFWEVWWNTHALPTLSTRTRTTYQALWVKHVSPTIGCSILRSVSRQEISTLAASLSATLAPATVRQCLAILQGVLERAVEWQYIGTNPAKGIKKPRLVQRRGRALTSNELEALISEMPDLRSQIIVRVLAGTGMRPGELRALRWSIRLSQEISVENAVSSNQIGPTKTNSVRSVLPTHDAALALREWWIASTAKQGNYSLVFPAVDGRDVWTDQGWRMWQRNVFAPAAERAGLKGVRPYDLRHTFASQRIAEGADVITLARSLGHSPTMTLTVYGHLLNQGGQDGRQDHPSSIPDGVGPRAAVALRASAAQANKT